MVEETKQAVKTATLKLHSMDFFPKDISIIDSIDLGSLDYNFAWNYLTNFPRFRGIASITSSEQTYNPATLYVPFERVDPNAVFNGYGTYKTNTWYQAGASIILRAKVQLRYIRALAYQLPDVTDLGYSSWIDALMPYAITTEATRQVFKMIGKDAEAAMYTQQAAEQALLVRNNFLLGEGY